MEANDSKNESKHFLLRWKYQIEKDYVEVTRDAGRR